MKYLQSVFMVWIMAMAAVSCSDEEYLEIDSLSADGDEFFCNQKVKVWMCVHSSDLWHTTYEWSCDGGSLTQPQGLNEMTWKAPNIPGVYTITCKATVGGESQVRSHKMNVSSYYFEKFEKSSHSFSLQKSNTNALKKEKNGNQYLQIRVNSSSEVKRYVRREFGDDNLCTPFSTRMKLGFDQNVPNTQRVKVGSTDEPAMLEYRWNMRSDLSNENSYISQIRMLWYPSVPADGYPAVPEEGLTLENTADYNVRLIVQYTGADGKKTTYNEYRKVEGLNTFKVAEYKTVSMSVDENERLLVYVAGDEVLTSNILSNARTVNGCPGNMYINNWEIYYINGNGGRNIPLMYMDDAYASTSELLK